MNPFLLAFLGSLAALVLAVVGVYTYLVIKVKPMFAHVLGDSAEIARRTEAQLAADRAAVDSLRADFAHGIKIGVAHEHARTNVELPPLGPEEQLELQMQLEYALGEVVRLRDVVRVYEQAAPDLLKLQLTYPRDNTRA
jgi:hypothetical protein